MKQDAVQPQLQKEGLEVIERNARAQSNLIADLLDISRIVAGKLRLEPRKLNFVTCLDKPIDPPQLIDAINTLIKTCAGATEGGQTLIPE
jgi:signal transduction histidine kinase